MKKLIITALLVFLASVSLFAQFEYLEKRNLPDADSPSIVISAGYIPKPSHNALKATYAMNNLLFKRIGAYVSQEKGIESGSFSTIYGLTGTLHPSVYIWAGADLATEEGIISNSFEGARKELGVGIIPFKNLVVKAGWSGLVGITIEAGLRIPLTLHL